MKKPANYDNTQASGEFTPVELGGHPYTTIIEQNAKVIREVLGGNCDLLEHHSNVTEDDKRMLDSLGEERDYRLLTERWENRIVFTTMVQFLNTFYGKGTRDM